MPPKKPAKKTRSKAKSTSKFGKVFLAFSILLIAILAAAFFYFYSKVFKVNLVLKNKQATFLYIKTDDTFEEVVNALTEEGWLVDKSSFVWLSEYMDYTGNIHPGRYRLKPEMTNRELVTLLRSGKQEPLRVTLQGIRTKEQLAGRIGRLLEADSLSLIRLLSDNDYLEAYGLNSDNALCLFLPDTYEFYWNTNSDAFVKKMSKSYNSFWNEAQLSKAKEIGLTPIEVQIIASIVVQESNQRDEWPIIAGVYINRFKKGMLLQADPTVKFALRNFDLRRIRSIHTSVDSPYNTYKYAGLPPGPIYMAGKQSMEAVLNYQRHSYLYFCARADRSGYHAFAKTFEEHKQNARKYQRSLNARGI